MNHIFKISKSQLTSIGLALLFYSTAISLTFPIANLSVILTVVSLSIGLLIGYKSVIGKPSTYLFIFILCYALSSYLLFKVGTNLYLFYLLSFCLYGLCGFVYSGLKIDYEGFYRITIIFALVVAYLILKIVVWGALPVLNGGKEIAKYYMTVSQAIGLMLPILFFSIFAESSKILRLVSFFLFSLYFTFMLIFGARSFVLSFIVFVCFWFLKNRNSFHFSNIAILMLPLAFLSVYFQEIIYFLHEVLIDMDIQSKSIARLVKYYESDGDVSAGRLELWRYALEGIQYSPLWGYGISSFESVYGTYPHNLFLQLLYEGGLFLALPIIFLFVKFGYLLFSKNIAKADWYFLAIVFSGGIIYLFLSTAIWRSLYFWFFVGFVLNFKVQKRHESQV